MFRRPESDDRTLGVRESGALICVALVCLVLGLGVGSDAEGPREVIGRALAGVAVVVGLVGLAGLAHGLLTRD